MSGHLGDRLSALLDSELDGTGAEAARRHLAGCALCTRELAEVRAARELVRSLPAVEPPPGFLERLVTGEARPAPAPWFRRGPALRPAGIAAFAASAAAAVAIVGFASPKEPPVRPAVDRFVESHATAASLSGDPLSSLAPVGIPVSFRR